MAFDTAISGIKASTADLNIIGNNVANSSTTGFKSSRGEFSDIYATSSLGVGSESVGKGVRLTDVAQQFEQGNISLTGSALDLAINGNGFFVLSDAGAPAYTRAGNFSLDQNGFVVDNQGRRLMAFEADPTGLITGAVSELQISTTLINPAPTALVDMTLNLDARDTVPTTAWGGPYNAFASPPTVPSPDMYNNTTSMTIYDGLGNPHLLSTYYVKTATPNQWQVHTLIDGVTVGGPDTLAFNSNGQFPTASLPVQVNIAGWTPLDASGSANGAAAQAFTVDLSPSTQYGADFGVLSLAQDGYPAGQLGGIDVADNGTVEAFFNNGQSLALGQVVMANFANTQGLQPIGDTSWVETFNSGAPLVGAPGSSGLGVIQSGALEDSNVELTEQLVKMIVAQRNFQANAQVIQTEDAITQTVINLR
ncbi:MAG TPA: flagellar hook protein FlgE [Porticoccaceae bacterium]|nr:flagellar hook protein FlgE [Porticoccaceae bacterium]